MIEFIPSDLWHLLYVATLSFLVGLELKTYRRLENIKKSHIGSTRTFTFIGILGFIFFKIDIGLFLSGYIALTVVYGIYYYYKLKNQRSSILSFLLISLVYSFAPLIERFDIWMPTLVFVLIVFILGANRNLNYLLKELNPQEFETLGKFLLLSSVILPILPNQPIGYINISPFKIWLVVVVVLSISYGSYIAQKYLFKNRGFLITAILGGLYSSTATTVVLAKKSINIRSQTIDSAIIIATSMMYIRLLILAYIFNLKIAFSLAFPMLFFAFLGIVISLFLYKKVDIKAPIDDRNPLELGTAFLFAFLFVLMMAITQFVTQYFGDVGLKVLSFIIGFTDIDPFVLSLLMKKQSTNYHLISSSILIASGSNNILKSIYSLIFSKMAAKKAAFWLFLLGVLTILYPFLIKEIL